MAIIEQKYTALQDLINKLEERKNELTNKNENLSELMTTVFKLQIENLNVIILEAKLLLDKEKELLEDAYTKGHWNIYQNKFEEYYKETFKEY